MGLSYDPEVAVSVLSKTDQTMAALIGRVGSFNLEVRDITSPFESLLEAIICQQLSSKAGATIHRRVLALFPDSEGPDPQGTLDLADEDLRGAGMSWAKVASAKDLAAKTLDGTVPTKAVLEAMDDEEIMHRAKLSADKGYPRDERGMNVQIFGLNYRLTDLQAAIARIQLRKADAIIARRQALGDRLCSLLEGIPGLYPPPARAGDRHSYWFFALRVLPEFGMSPDQFAEALSAEGIPCSAHYIGIPIYRFDLWQKPVLGRRFHFNEHECPNAEDALAHVVQIGWNENYADDVPDDVARAVRKIAKNAKQ